MNNKIMHSFKIEKDLLDKAKEKAKKHGISLSAYIRQAIIEKIENKKRLDKMEERLRILEII